MRYARVTIFWPVRIPALVERCELINAKDNLAGGLRVNFREDAFLNEDSLGNLNRMSDISHKLFLEFLKET
jgi:hypothetical protein